MVGWKEGGKEGGLWRYTYSYQLLAGTHYMATSWLRHATFARIRGRKYVRSLRERGSASLKWRQGIKVFRMKAPRPRSISLDPG